MDAVRLTVPTVTTLAPYLVAIDPGLRHAGVAIFDLGGVLVACEVTRARDKGSDPLALNESVAAYVTKFVREHLSADKPLRVVAEWPRVFGRGKSKGDPNDLLPLSGCSSACVARLRPETCAAVRPDEWKGQAPTDTVVRARVASRLSPREANILAHAEHAAGKTLGHNVLDAVGIGLFAVGRFESLRIFAR